VKKVGVEIRVLKIRKKLIQDIAQKNIYIELLALQTKIKGVLIKSIK
jgi:hypothetical protein